MFQKILFALFVGVFTGPFALFSDIAIFLSHGAVKNRIRRAADESTKKKCRKKRST